MINTTQLGALVFLVMQATVVAAQTERVFVSNYDLQIRVGDESGSVQSQARVRDGHAFPVELRNIKTEVQISGTSESAYVAVLSIYEKTQSGWYLVTVEKPRFEGRFGVPVQFSWASGDVSLEVAMAVGIDAVAVKQDRP